MLKLAEANRDCRRKRMPAITGTPLASPCVIRWVILSLTSGWTTLLRLSSYGSIGKAIASAGLGLPSGEESDVDLYRSSVGGVLAHGLAVIRRPGGLPVKRRAEVEGSIGVSGAPTEEQAEECARRGIEAIGCER